MQPLPVDQVKEEFYDPQEGKLALHGSKFELAYFQCVLTTQRHYASNSYCFLTSIMHTAPSDMLDEVIEEFDAPQEEFDAPQEGKLGSNI